MAAASNLVLVGAMPKRRGKRHLWEARLSYFKHMRRAFGFSWLCYKSSIKAIIHGLFPRWFQNTSEEIEEWLI